MEPRACVAVADVCRFAASAEVKVKYNRFPRRIKYTFSRFISYFMLL